MTRGRLMRVRRATSFAIALQTTQVRNKRREPERDTVLLAEKPSQEQRRLARYPL